MVKAVMKKSRVGTGGRRGRPCKYASAAQVQKRIDAYFMECDEADGIYTITGLALALDLTRQEQDWQVAANERA
jgi:DNA-packaging protein gp3